MNRPLIRPAAFILLLFISTPLHGADKMRAASGGFSTAIHAVLWAAQEQKIFRKYGLETEYLALESGSLGMQTLVADELQILFTTGALAVSANLQAANVTIIAGGLNFYPYQLVVRSEIKRAADLVGKSVAISRFGSSTDYALQAALTKLGVNPKQVNFIQIGNNMTRLAATNAGNAQGAVLSEPASSIAVKRFGLHSLVDLGELGIPFPQNSFVVKRSYLNEHRPRVVNFMKAAIESLFLLKKRQAPGHQAHQKICARR